jgi:hypothetical protein
MYRFLNLSGKALRASSPPATRSNPGYWHVSSCLIFSNPGLSIRRKQEQVGQIALQAPHETQVEA